MNDLNFAGLIAARQAATQARQGNQAPERNPDPREAASAFDAVMARANRNEATRSSESVAEARRARQPEPVRNGQGKPQAPQAPQRDTQAGAGARNTMAERTHAQGDSENATAKPVKDEPAGGKPAGDKSCAEAPAAQDAAAALALGIPVPPPAPVQSMPESPATTGTAAVAEAGAAGVQAGVVASAQRPADELDLESLSTVIRSDDPLADALPTPRGLARALVPDEAAARAEKSPAGAQPASDGAGEAAAHAAPFERLVEAAQRETMALREFGRGGADRRVGGNAEAATTTLRVDTGSAGLAASALALTPAAPATYSVAHGSVSAPVEQSVFAEEFAQRVVMFTSQKVHNAQIALNPAELGPISISIDVRGQEAHLNFSAAHATTRAAIEEALPKLREMFAANGLQLANAHVGDQPAQRDFGRQRRSGDASQVHAAGTAASSGGSNTGAGIDTNAMRTQWLRSDRLIDIVV